MQKQNINNKKAFTLVELIIVITILSILATIGFVSFQGYTRDARDSNRLGSIASIQKGLEMIQVKSGTYPEPEKITRIEASGALIGKQGEIGDQVSSIIKMSQTPLDPLDHFPYVYLVNTNNRKYQLLSYMEGKKEVAIVTQTYADDKNEREPQVFGDSLGILLNEDNSPVSGTGVDIIKTNGNYKAVLNNTSSGVVSGSGKTLFTSLAMKRKELNLLDQSLVGYWDMETITNDGKLKDLSIINNNGTCYGSGIVVSCGTIGQGPQIINGKNGKAMNFNGVNNYIQHILSPYDFENQSFSVDFIMKQEDLSNWGFIFAEGAVGGGWSVRSSGGNDLCTFIKNNGNSQSQFCSSLGGNFNTWNHFSIVTTTSTTDSLYIRNSKIFLNGSIIAGNTAQDGFVYNKSDTPFSIGGRNGGSINMFHGDIDEIRIYNRALSDSEIQGLYDATK